MEALYALRQQQKLALSIGSPHLGGDRFLVLLQADYGKDPQRDFFGLGNNNVFAGAGRVFIDRDDLARRFAPGDAARLRFAGGPGLPIALSQALVARIDVGFSEEEAGIVYLAFGHAF